MPRRPHTPSYRLHRPSGQAVVTLSGRDYYLGRHGSPESEAEYRRLLAEWLARGQAPPPTPEARAPADLTVSEVLAAYWRHAQSYYVKGGKPTSQQERVARSIGVVRGLYGPTPARDFGPLALKACRQAMVGRGWVRRHVNHCVGCVVRCFKWAASEELVPPSVYHGLRSVEGLRRGRCEARESDPVLPAPGEHVEAALPFLLPVLRAVVRLQLLTAMRPGEALALRGEDLDRSGPVWLYRPAAHKTEHRGHERVVFVGPKAQALLGPYLRPGYLFSPREAVAARYRELGRAVRFGRGRVPGDRYQVTSYSRAVNKACRKAGVPPWHPHQLRHSAATNLVAEFGWDVARIVLGHRCLDATRIYGENNTQKAVEVIRKVG